MEAALAKAQGHSKTAGAADQPHASNGETDATSGASEAKAPTAEPHSSTTAAQERLEQRVRELEAREQAARSQEAKASRAAEQGLKESHALRAKVSCCAVGCSAGMSVQPNAVRQHAPSGASSAWLLQGTNLCCWVWALG